MEGIIGIEKIGPRINKGRCSGRPLCICYRAVDYNDNAASLRCQ